VLAVSTWNSLEVAKLAVGILTPLLLVGLGVLINRTAQRVEDAQWANRRVLDRRLELYDDMAKPLNDLYCFFRARGGFREIDPHEALTLKRELDKLFHVNRFLFSPRFGDLYGQLMQTYFRTYTGTGKPAEIKSPIDFQRAERTEAHWNSDWKTLFDRNAQLAAGDLEGLRRYLTSVDVAYTTLMTAFAEEVGVRSASRGAGKRRRQPDAGASITAAPASGATIDS
jgi:hypothetical protein